MPIFKRVINQDKAESILSNLQDNFLAAMENVSENLAYQKDSLAELKRSPNAEVNLTEIEAYQDDIIQNTEYIKQVTEKIERNNRIKKQTTIPCFFIEKTTSNTEIKRLLTCIKSLLKTNSSTDDALLLKTIQESAETYENNLILGTPLDIYIPINGDEIDRVDALLSLFLNLEEDYKQANAFGKYAIFVNALEYNLGGFVERVIHDNHFIYPSDCLKNLRDIYPLFDVTHYTNYSQAEIAILNQLRSDIDSLIKTRKMPIDGIEFQHNLNQAISNAVTDSLLQKKILNFAFKQTINELCKYTNLTPPFSLTKTLSHAMQSLREFKQHIYRSEPNSDSISDTSSETTASISDTENENEDDSSSDQARNER